MRSSSGCDGRPDKRAQRGVRQGCPQRSKRTQLACAQRRQADARRCHRHGMEERPWHLKDPEQTLRDIDRLCPFELDHVIVASVELDSQHVTDARLAMTGELADDLHGRGLARRLAEEMVPERWANGREGNGITHVFVTVVCRDGRAIYTQRESSWLLAWRYANHFRAAFDGDVYVVTPHGWTGSI